MRRAVTFVSQGLRCSGWLYAPDDLAPGGWAPAIAMAHGLSAVKEMALPAFAERFCAAGFVTLLFDYRYFGGSEGEPRGQMFWDEQLEDYRNALTWLSLQPEVDPARLGMWGTSYSGGHALYLPAFDRRIKAAVAQVPFADSWDTPREEDAAFDAFLCEDRRARYTTGVVNDMAVVAPAGTPSLFGPGETYDWFMAAAQSAPTWRNAITVASLERGREYAPATPIHLVAPTPLLLIVAAHDTVTPAAVARAAYERAGEPKAFITLPCVHYEVYSGTYATQAAEAAVDWFTRHLGTAHLTPATSGKSNSNISSKS